MTLERAIEILERMFGFVENWDPIEEQEAFKLGIEALKREQRRRTLVSYHPDDVFIQLRGESKSTRGTHEREATYY